MNLLQSSGGLVNVSVWESCCFLFFLVLYLCCFILSCLAQGEVPLHLYFAILFGHFYFNAAFGVLTALSCMILILCLGAYNKMYSSIKCLMKAHYVRVTGLHVGLQSRIEWVALCLAEQQTKKMICTKQRWGAGKASL